MVDSSDRGGEQGRGGIDRPGHNVTVRFEGMKPQMMRAPLACLIDPLGFVVYDEDGICHTRVGFSGRIEISGD